METGDTFRRNYGSHLWVVVSDPAIDAMQVLLVNMTSVRASFHDPACVINAGEHSFVKHATYMNYRDSKIVAKSELNQQLSAGQIVLENNVSDALLQRIRDGAAKSEFIPLGHKQLLIDQGFIADP